MILPIPTVHGLRIPVRICTWVNRIAERVDSSLQVTLRVNGTIQTDARNYMGVSMLDGVWGEHLTLEVDNVPPDKEKEVTWILEQGREEVRKVQAGIMVDRP